MQPFDGSKIKITRVRKEKNWGGNAVHFRYEGKTYRASIREDPDSEDESGNRVCYAHLQVADKNGNWGNDIAAKDDIDIIPVGLNQVANDARVRKSLRFVGHEPSSFPQTCRYDRAIPYKFYDTMSFASFLNETFVK
jgi:hypothetical protein